MIEPKYLGPAFEVQVPFNSTWTRVRAVFVIDNGFNSLRYEFEHDNYSLKEQDRIRDVARKPLIQAYNKHAENIGLPLLTIDSFS